MTVARRWVGPAAAAGAVAAACGYAWWATSLHPFTVTAYGTVAGPVALVLAAAMRRTPGTSRRQEVEGGTTQAAVATGGRTGIGVRSTGPWLGLLSLAVCLEAAALALGGRSRIVPTASTVADHALAWHGVRMVLFLAWLAAGLVPSIRRVRRAGGGSRP